MAGSAVKIDDAVEVLSEQLAEASWDFVKTCGGKVAEDKDGPRYAISEDMVLSILQVTSGQLGFWLQVAQELGLDTDELSKLVGSAVTEGRKDGKGVAGPMPVEFGRKLN